MIFSSSRAARLARDVDALVAAEWALEDLRVSETIDFTAMAEPEPEPEPGPTPEELVAQQLAEERARDAEERERLIREAYERGYEEGRHAGEELEGARLRSAVRVAEQALDEVREGEARWTGSIEENICALAVAIARQVIGRELASDPGIVVDLVRGALGEFPIDQPVRIRVNPQDLAAIEAHGEEGGEALLRGIARGRDARWLPDPRLAPGGCVVEGRDRIVDGRVDNALERIYRRLTYTNA